MVLSSAPLRREETNWLPILPESHPCSLLASLLCAGGTISRNSPKSVRKPYRSDKNHLFHRLADIAFLYLSQEIFTGISGPITINRRRQFAGHRCAVRHG